MLCLYKIQLNFVIITNYFHNLLCSLELGLSNSKVSEKHYKITIKLVHTKGVLYFKPYDIFFIRIRLKFKLLLAENIAICSTFPHFYSKSFKTSLND